MALGLVAFLSVMALLIAAFVRLEVVRAGSGIVAVEARAAALYGLREGLAELVRMAGGDCVVTAQFAASGDDVPAGWTGVWETATGERIGLLFSGPADWSAESVVVARRGRESAVHVPLRAGESGMHYAWWVDDEGRKASMGTPSMMPGQVDPDPGVLAQVLSAAAFLPLSSVESTDDAGRKGEELALRSRMLRLTDWDFMEGADPAVAAFLAEDYTVLARGVPADTGRGGLRQNLAMMAADDVTDDWLRGVLEVLSARVGEDGVIRPQGKADEDLEVPSALIELAPRPVISEVGIYLWLARHPAPNQQRLKAHLTLRLNLWNPYAGRMAGDCCEDSAAVYIDLGGLPPVVAEWSTADGAMAGLCQINPASLVWRLDASQLSGQPLSLERLPISYSHLNPGEVRTFSIRLTALLEDQVIDPTPHRYTDDTYSLRAAAAQTRLGARLPDGRLIVEFRPVRFVAANSADYRDLQLSAVSMTGSPAYGDAALVWHWALQEEYVWADDGTQPPAEVRYWRFAPGSATVPIDPRSAIYRVSEDPGAAPLDLQIFSGRPALFYGGNGSLGRNYMTLYDFAATHPVSLAYLYNGCVDGPDHSREQINGLFDQFYYLPTADSPGEQWLLDQRFPAAAMDSETPPLLTGAFNINSTSIGAWRSVLASRSIDDWSYRTLSSQPRTVRRLRNAVFRFSHCAHFSAWGPWDEMAGYPDVDAAASEEWYRYSWSPQWMRAWSAGLRVLTDGEVEELATQIVGRLQQRGRPFGTLAEAAADPWLQEAIDLTSINVVGDEPYNEAEVEQRFPRHSPAFVSQADLIALLEPIWAVRSDTFTVRAYGRVDGLNGEIVAQAWCEARVQRLPAGDSQSRPFHVESFRWLNDDEI